MKIQFVALIVLVACVITAVVTRYYYPVVEYKNKEVVKEVIKNDIKTIVKEVVRPDGTKEVITVITDNSTKKESVIKETITTQKKQWLVGLTAQQSLKSREQALELTVAKRQVGPFYGVGQLRVQRDDVYVGIGALIEF